jgi:starch-binding outer membrane protein, SusD/RagB family
MATTTTRTRAALLLAAAVVLPLAACGSPTDNLLEAEDPDIINPANVNSPESADALARGAVQRFKQLTVGAGFNEENMWMLGGLLADEYRLGDTFFDRIMIDRREISVQGGVTANARILAAYRYIHRGRLAANLAIRALRQYRPTAAADLGEMYMIRGYAEMTVAENFCNGTPLSDASGDEIAYGQPMSNAEIFRVALTSVDSGLTAVGTAADARSTLVRNTLRTLRGRILLDLGQFAEAGQAVAGVPTDFRYTVTFSVPTGENRITELTNSANRYPVADREGTNGVPFVSAADPRVPTCVGGSAECRVAPNRLSFDAVTPFQAQLLWPQRDSPVGVLTGVDARLVEAESRLRAGDVPGMLQVLNALRGTPSLYACPAASLVTNVPSCQATPAALPALADPGTARAREDLLFREKAFWQFSRGYRLPDLRRLVRQYGRTQESVFPVGPHPREAGNYGSDVTFPVPQAEQNNPNFVALGCTDRSA